MPNAVFIALVSIIIVHNHQCSGRKTGLHHQQYRCRCRDHWYVRLRADSADSSITISRSVFSSQVLTPRCQGSQRSDVDPWLWRDVWRSFPAALFMSLFVIYGFDTAGTLGEETRNPQKNAPRGVLWSIGLSFIAGLLFLGGTLLSIKNYPKIEGIAQGPNFLTALPQIIQDALGPFWGNVYLFVVLIAVFVCTLAIQSATIRLMFSMGARWSPTLRQSLGHSEHDIPHPALGRCRRRGACRAAFPLSVLPSASLSQAQQD